MKQRITIEQLQELTAEQQEHLQELWEPEDGDWIAQVEHNYVMLIEQGSMEISPKTTIKYNFLPLLSIGRMIDLLWTIQKEEEEMEEEQEPIEEKGLNARKSEVQAEMESGDKQDREDTEEYRISWRTDEELADRLWESLKIYLSEG